MYFRRKSSSEQRLGSRFDKSTGLILDNVHKQLGVLGATVHIAWKVMFSLRFASPLIAVDFPIIFMSHQAPTIGLLRSTR